MSTEKEQTITALIPIKDAQLVIYRDEQGYSVGFEQLNLKWILEQWIDMVKNYQPDQMDNPKASPDLPPFAEWQLEIEFADSRKFTLFMECMDKDKDVYSFPTIRQVGKRSFFVSYFPTTCEEQVIQLQEIFASKEPPAVEGTLEVHPRENGKGNEVTEARMIFANGYQTGWAGIDIDEQKKQEMQAVLDGFERNLYHPDSAFDSIPYEE